MTQHKNISEFCDNLDEKATLKQVNCFLYWLDGQSFLGRDNRDGMDIVENPEKYNREYQLFMLDFVVPSCVKEEHNLIVCQNEIGRALFRDEETASELEEHWVACGITS